MTYVPKHNKTHYKFCYAGAWVNKTYNRYFITFELRLDNYMP